MKKRFRMLSLLLSACMMLNLAPMTAFASEEQPVIEQPASQDESPELSAPVPEQTEASEEAPAEETNPDIEETENTEETETTENSEEKENPESPENPEDPENPSEKELNLDDIEEKDPKALEEEKLLVDKELLGADEKKYDYFNVDENGTLSLKVNKNELKENITLAMFEEAGTVKRINADVFAGTDIKSIEIPNTVEEFGEGAFEGCKQLTSVVFQEDSKFTAISKKMFSGCTSLRWAKNTHYFTIPASVTAIGEGAFEYCGSLYGIDFTYATNLQTIEDNAFRECKSLCELKNFNQTVVTTIGKRAFETTSIDDSVKFPATLSYIKTSAFSGCSDLGTLNFKNTALTDTGIEAGCFAGSGLLGIVLPASYKTIPEEIFADCNSLTEITIGADKAGEGVEKVCANAFKNCKNLKKIIIKNSVTEIEDDAFIGCNGVNEIYIEQYNDKTHLTSVKLTADSFPINSGMTVSSFNGTAEKWVGQHLDDGVKFVTLFKGNIVKTIVNDKNRLEATPNGKDGKEVKVGTKVTLKDTAFSGYYIVSLTHGPNKDFVDASKTFVVAPSDINSDGDVQAEAYFSTLTTDKFSFVDNVDDSKNTITKKSDTEYVTTYDTASQIKQLNIKVKPKNRKAEFSNPWLWTFTSSDKNIATVDGNGKVKLLKKTPFNKDVTITAKLKAHESTCIKLHIYVDNETAFSNIEGIDFDFNNHADDFETGDDATAGMPYVQIDREWAKSGISNGLTRDFNAIVKAVDANGKPLEANFKWTSGDTKLVKVKSTTTDCNENTIKICGIGETTVTATSTTDTSKSISFIVRVIDKTPYVADSTITINSKATEVDTNYNINKGVEFTLVKAYGGAIASKHIGVYKKNGNKYEYLDKAFVVERESDESDAIQKMLIAVPQNSAYYSKNASYTNLYLRLRVDGSDYYTALPKVTVVNKKPSPSIAKVTGKINTFYTGDAEEQTGVEVKIKTPVGFSFDTGYTPVLKAAASDKESNFTDNFEVVPSANGDYSTITIKQKPSGALVTNEKNKVVNSGIIRFKYKGYDPCELKVTVPVGRTAPALALDKTTVATHKFAGSQLYKVSLINKKNKEVVQLDDSFTNVEYTSQSSSFFYDLKPTLDKADNAIDISLDDAPSSSAKAYITIENTDWTEDMTFPLTVKVSSTKPQVVLGERGQINLNVATSNTNYIPFEVKSDFVDPSTIMFGPAGNDNKLEPVGKGKAKENADKISVKYVDGKIVANLINPADKPANGTYTFNGTYSVEYTGSTVERYSAPVTVKVKVYNTKPSLKLKTTKATLNDYLYGVTNDGQAAEIATVPYTVINTAAGAADVINNNFTVTNITNRKAPYVDNRIDVSLADGEMKIFLNGRLGKTQKYRVSGLEIDGIESNDFEFTVNSIDKEPVVTLKADNKKINVLDPTTKVSYTMSVKNFNGKLDANKFALTMQDKTEKNSKGWNRDTDTFHFVIADQKDNTFKLIANPKYEGQLQSRNYTLVGHYTFGTNANGKACKSKDVQIKTKPIQTLPKVTVEKKTPTVYIGNKNKTDCLKLSPVKGSGATVNRIEISSKTPANVKKAFDTPVYKDGELIIKIKNGALLKKNTTYTLTYNIKWDGQLNDTNGTEFTVKVTVK